MAPTITSTTEDKSVSKSDFIRAQPATMSAAQIVEKAKGQGIPLRAGLVYEVRRTDKAKKAGGPKHRGPAASAKAVRTRAAKSAAMPARSAGARKQPRSKAAFVRAHASLSPKEIVEKAKAENIKLDVGYVYNVRSSNKTAKKRGAGQAVRRGARPTGVSSPDTAGSDVEVLLKVVAAEVGLGRALEVLQAERAKIGAALRA